MLYAADAVCVLAFCFKIARMAKSNLDIFKVGVGPSSSHTLGPMLAAAAFLQKLGTGVEKTVQVKCTLYGSLSLTGRGHLTDKAVLWGLSGLKPSDLTPALQQEAVSLAFTEHRLRLGGQHEIHFDYRSDLTFSKEFLPEHQNALTLEALDAQGRSICAETYFSTGGGFIKTKAQLNAEQAGAGDEADFGDKFSIENTKVALRLCQDDSLNLAELSLRYELQFHDLPYIENWCREIWQVMQEAFEHGLKPANPYLPGSLHLKRRAPSMLSVLQEHNDPFAVIDKVSLYAISIAEENASGAKVVTAPTNGACAVVPAVLLYLKDNAPHFDDRLVRDFLLTGMLIGSFYKNNATISGAEGGCQAEIGSASSMAAAAMTTVMGGDAFKACAAAEIAMEHHLGLTCDPVDGLVQIPCIERNAFGAVKAITAARIALKRQSQPRVSLDEVIKTMYITGKDISFKYKETALGGLAELQLDH